MEGFPRGRLCHCGSPATDSSHSVCVCVRESAFQVLLEWTSFWPTCDSIHLSFWLTLLPPPAVVIGARGEGPDRLVDLSHTHTHTHTHTHNPESQGLLSSITILMLVGVRDGKGALNHDSSHLAVRMLRT